MSPYKIFLCDSIDSLKEGLNLTNNDSIHIIGEPYNEGIFFMPSKDISYIKKLLLFLNEEDSENKRTGVLIFLHSLKPTKIPLEITDIEEIFLGD